MRRASALSAVLVCLAVVAAGCHDDNNMTVNPLAQPVVTNIQPNPTHSNSVLIIAGTRFDQTARFDLRQNGISKATLANPILATGTPSTGVQINATIPEGTPLGKYQACVTTVFGTGCGPDLIEVF